MDALDFIVDRDQHMRPLEYDLSENFNELLRYMQDIGVLGNVPTGVTSESEIVSISDAYAAPPMALTVDGASTQVTTTGKNLLSDVKADWQKLTIPNVATRWVYFIAVDDGASYTYSRNSTGIGLYVAWCDDTQLDGYTGQITLTNYSTRTFTNSSNHPYLVFSYAGSYTSSEVAANLRKSNVMVEAGSTATAYEPYTGGAASPRPDWPQPVLSVDALALKNVRGKNLLPRVLRNSTIYGLDDSGFYLLGSTSFAWSYANRAASVTLPAGTYTVSASLLSAETDSNAEVRVYSSNDMRLARVLLNTANSVTFTLTERAAVGIGIKMYVSGNHAELQVQAGSVASAYQPYVTPTTVPIPFGDHSVRSLPNGTNDVLTLSYLRPSTREGWAWYSRALTALVGETTTAATDGITGTVGVDVMSTTGEIADGPTVLYKLATPITTQLDPIELPTLPAPTATVWCDGGSAQPTLVLEYVRDANAVVAELSEAIADIISG